MILRRLLVLAMASFVLGLPAYSQPADSPGIGHRATPFDKLQGKNALTDDQKKQLEALSADLYSQVQVKAPAVRAKRVELLNGLTEAKIDTAKLQDLQGQLNSASDDMNNIILQNQIKQMQVLTPEQRVLLRPTAGEASQPSAGSDK
jgi:Spy/CpxP family protein refolding chaperone